MHEKLKTLHKAFDDKLSRDVAIMIATSHEYKTPNIKAGLHFTKNYDWQEGTININNLQGINKPIIQEKVDDIAKGIEKTGKISPFVVVNQLDGIRPQTPGKKILIDGHHRLEACKKAGVTEVPVYIGTYHGKAHKSLDELAEKTAAENEIEENVYYHASPVQDIKRFRHSQDTSGNNKGKVIFASKHPSFSAAFGTRWHDGIARLNVETSNTKVPDEDNYVGTTLRYTDKVNVDAPCSMYKLKGSFKPLRYNKDLESFTNNDVRIVSEEKFKSFKDMAKAYGLNLKQVSDKYVLNKLKSKKSSNFEKKAMYISEIEKLADVKKNIEYNPYQERVLNNPSNSMIVAHSVGSGKTLTGIAKFEKLRREGKAHKALVVVPAGLRDNFGHEGVKKFTNSSYNIIGNKQEVSQGLYKSLDPKADYNIVSYEMFRKNPEKYIRESGADTVIADEFHRTKNEKTSTLGSFKSTRRMYKNFIGLTGSIVSNGVSDVQPLVDVASNKKHALGHTKKEFDEKWVQRNSLGPYKYLRKDRRPVIGFNNPNALKKELGKYIDYADNDDMRDIAKIPKKQVSVVKVPLTKEQLKIYKGIVNKNPNVKKLIYRKRIETLKDDEVARAYNELIEGRKLMNSVGSVVPGIDLKTSANITPKTKRMLDDMETHIKHTPDGQAILLTNLVNGGSDVLEAGLKQRHINYGKFIGKGNPGVDEASRQKDVVDFTKRKKRVMIINGAGAEGISLGNTTWEGLLDPHYNPERMNQMEARGIRAHGLSHRAPQDRVVHVNRYVATMPKTLGIFKKAPYKTPDEVIYEIAHNKDKQNQMLYHMLKENERNANKKQGFQK